MATPFRQATQQRRRSSTSKTTKKTAALMSPITTTTTASKKAPKKAGKPNPTKGTDGKEPCHDVYLGRSAHGLPRSNSLYKSLIKQHFEEYAGVSSRDKRSFAWFKIIQPILQKHGIFYELEGDKWKQCSLERVVKTVMQSLRDHQKRRVKMSVDSGKKQEDAAWIDILGAMDHHHRDDGDEQRHEHDGGDGKTQQESEYAAAANHQGRHPSFQPKATDCDMGMGMDMNTNTNMGVQAVATATATATATAPVRAGGNHDEFRSNLIETDPTKLDAIHLSFGEFLGFQAAGMVTTHAAPSVSASNDARKPEAVSLQPTQQHLHAKEFKISKNSSFVSDAFVGAPACDEKSCDPAKTNPSHQTAENASRRKQHKMSTDRSEVVAMRHQKPAARYPQRQQESPQPTIGKSSQKSRQPTCSSLPPPPPPLLATTSSQRVVSPTMNQANHGPAQTPFQEVFSECIFHISRLEHLVHKLKHENDKLRGAKDVPPPLHPQHHHHRRQQQEQPGTNINSLNV
eukprot:CAMPEP_0119550816 /NCGR_PEP_ID=MMETSP1352-20130426/4256_1 /TAXON_ID=265584 /ORGANISM="Stauroneis constricta, Strain CCMP1120" /LENGTH=513 /DNA_ID=CAMNT_0007596783 /DNA_START=166 /DNA_END=1707 /DNA_ORIENTATION=+